MIAYRISGSLWPPILMHWITVLVWTMFLGGKKLLTGA
jgi:predicted Abi (CAAX) family protease